MEALGVAANIIAVVEISTKVIGLVAQYAIEVKHADDDRARLGAAVTSINYVAQRVDGLIQSNRGSKLPSRELLSAAILESKAQLLQLEQKLDPGSSLGSRAKNVKKLRWPFQSKDVKRIVEELKARAEVMTMCLQVDQTSMLLDVDRNTALGRLDIATGASFDSNAEEENQENLCPTCLPNTRVEILRRITGWSLDPTQNNVFWLNGMAGTGKSTISRTLCRSLAESGCLGASFFFKRSEAERNTTLKLFTTIAADLASRIPGTARHIFKAANDASGLVGRSLRDQFNRLVVQPLLKSSLDLSHPKAIIIVIDALDECTSLANIKLLIDLFANTRIGLPIPLKVFMTSRPDLPLRLGFKRIQGQYDGLILDQIPEAVTKQDIVVFLQCMFARIQSDYNALVPETRWLSNDWPGKANAAFLADIATPLFIFAATICRFLADHNRGSPQRQLEKILAYRTKSQQSGLDLTYLPVLEQQLVGLSKSEAQDVIGEFRQIIGPIITLSNPLPASALAPLLDISQSIIDDRLALLHSVLSVPSSPDIPIKTFHLSFRDFLVDPNKEGTNPFWIDEKKVHKSLARNCLRVMRLHLREDICDLRWPGTTIPEISSQQIDSGLPNHLCYACLNWALHLENSAIKQSDEDDVLSFLKDHFLHWVEALSLMGCTGKVVMLIRQLQHIFKGRDANELSDFLSDANRFVFANLLTIETTPLQLYSSALIFAPENSIMKRTFSPPDWILALPTVESDWSQCLQRFEVGKRLAEAIAFSHDSKYLATATVDYEIHVWLVDAGVCIHILRGHGGAIKCLCFSPNSTFLASISADKSVRLWLTETGELVQNHRYEGKVFTAAFSDDLSMFGVACEDGVVMLHSTQDGHCMVRSDHRIRGCKTASFLQGLMRVAFHCEIYDEGEKRESIKLCLTKTGECLREMALDDMYGSLTHIFCPGSSLVLVTRKLGVVHIIIRQAETGQLVKEITVSKPAISKCISFSPDLKFVAMSGDSVWIYEIDTGNYVLKIKGSSFDVNAGCFSGDSSRLATATNSIAQIWLLNQKRSDGEAHHKQSGSRLDCIDSTHLTMESTAVLGSSKFFTVDALGRTQLWDAETGSYVKEVGGYNSGSGFRFLRVAMCQDSKLWTLISLPHGGVQLWDFDSLRAATACDVLGHLEESTTDHGVGWETLGFYDRICLAGLDATCLDWIILSPDAKLVAAIHFHESCFRVWSTATGICLLKTSFPDNWSPTSNAAFSSDSQLMAIISYQQVGIWRTDSGGLERVIRSPHSSMSWGGCIAFSSDSTLLAVAWVRGISLFRVDTGDHLQYFNTGSLSQQLAFKPDGRTILTNKGAFSIHHTALVEPSSPNWLELATHEPIFSGLGISLDGTYPIRRKATPLASS